MDEKFIKILNSFKNIKPDSGYAERSKRLILIAPQKLSFTTKTMLSMKTSLVLAGSLMLVAAILFIGVGNLTIRGGEQPLLSSLNAEDLRSEIKDLDINIKLGTASYYGTEQLGVAAKDGDEISEILDKIAL